MTPAAATIDADRDTQGRGTRRLAMARTLLAASPARFGLTPGRVRDTTELPLVLAAINALEPASREHLRSLVDWVEDFDDGQ